MEVFCLGMIFKTVKLDERIKDVSVDRKENLSNDWAMKYKNRSKGELESTRDTEEKQWLKRNTGEVWYPNIHVKKNVSRR